MNQELNFRIVNQQEECYRENAAVDVYAIDCFKSSLQLAVTTLVTYPCLKAVDSGHRF
jgi:hypothetical protein